MRFRNPLSTMPRTQTGIRNLTRIFQELAKKNINPLKKLHIVDIACGPARTPTWSSMLCPCLTRTRAGGRLS